MPIVNGLIGVLLLLLAVTVVDAPIVRGILVASSLLAFLTVRPDILAKPIIWVFRVMATLLLFATLGTFLHWTSSFAVNWYLDADNNNLLGMALGSVALMVILSEYSCCIKNDHVVETNVTAAQKARTFVEKLQSSRA